MYLLSEYVVLPACIACYAASRCHRLSANLSVEAAACARLEARATPIVSLNFAGAKCLFSLTKYK